MDTHDLSGFVILSHLSTCHLLLARLLMFPSGMEPNADFALAKLIAEKLKGKFWEVTAGEWWVTIEGVSAQRLIIWTNDPFGITFTPKDLTMSLAHVQQKVMGYLIAEEIVLEDGSWRYLASA